MPTQSARLPCPEYPYHREKIRRAFYLGMYPVTRGQFREFIKKTGYKTSAEKEDSFGETGAPDWSNPKAPHYFEWHKDWSWRKTGFPQTDDHPVINVSWKDAVAFCHWLSRKEKKTYRLPTEAEWEYACRAGTTTRYSFGDTQERLAEFANVADAAAKKERPDFYFTIKANDGFVFTSPVGHYRPNAFGLFDMHGNVSQWCADVFENDYYERSPETDPPGPFDDTGFESRSARGGTWASGAWACRSSIRISKDPDDRESWLGFRVARER